MRIGKTIRRIILLCFTSELSRFGLKFSSKCKISMKKEIITRSSSFLLQYFVSSDMVEAPQPTIQMMPTTTSNSGHTIVDTQSLHHSGKIRIVNNDEVAAALQPTRKIITINNQQYVVSQGGQGTYLFLANKSYFLFL